MCGWAECGQRPGARLSRRYAIDFPRADLVLFFNPSSLGGSHSTVPVKRVPVPFSLVQSAIATPPTIGEIKANVYLSGDTDGLG